MFEILYSIGLPQSDPWTFCLGDNVFRWCEGAIEGRTQQTDRIIDVEKIGLYFQFQTRIEL